MSTKPTLSPDQILGVMCRIQHPESYYQTAAESKGMNWRKMSHQEIVVWRASLLRSEAEALIAFSQDEGPTFDVDAASERVMEMMKAGAEQPQPVAETPNRAMYEALKACHEELRTAAMQYVSAPQTDKVIAQAAAALAAYEQHTPQQPDGDAHRRLTNVVEHLVEADLIEPGSGMHAELNAILQLLTPSKS